MKTSAFGQITLPDYEMHTTAVWWQVEAAALQRVFAQPWRALDGFLGAAYAMHYVATLLTMSELHDLGRAVGNSDATWFATVGMERRGQPHVSAPMASSPRMSATLNHAVSSTTTTQAALASPRRSTIDGARIVRQAYALVTACGCLYGCPACVGPILAAGE